MGYSKSHMRMKVLSRGNKKSWLWCIGETIPSRSSRYKTILYMHTLQHSFWTLNIYNICMQFLEPEDGDVLRVKLEDILIFATCASEVPPLGLEPNPSTKFWNDVRPRSNTCGNVLFLSLHKMNSEVSYEEFKSLMDDAIINSPTFGTPWI